MRQVFTAECHEPARSSSYLSAAPGLPSSIPMRFMLPLAVVTSTASLASAATIGGDVVTVQPASSQIEGGGLGMWAAKEVGDGGGYLGGELSIGSYVTPRDAGISYHVLGGLKSELSDHFLVLADVGAGVTQQLEMRLGLFGGEAGIDTVDWLPSSAVRLQVVAVFGSVRDTDIGMTINSEARAGYTNDEITTGIGLGLGVYLTR